MIKPRLPPREDSNHPVKANLAGWLIEAHYQPHSYATCGCQQALSLKSFADSSPNARFLALQVEQFKFWSASISILGAKSRTVAFIDIIESGRESTGGACNAQPNKAALNERCFMKV